MERKELGETGVQVPEIGLGTWAYTGGVEPLRRGISLSAILVDTAEAYSTEEVVGRAVRGIRDQVFIATKVSPSHFRREELLRAADHSLRRLGTDFIDLYQLHWPNSAVPIQETMGAMEELVDAGKVRFIGVSNFSAAQLQEAQAAMTRHRAVANQVRYNLADRHIEAELLPYCQRTGVTVIAYSPLARGLDNLRRLDRTGALVRIARETGRSEAQVALNWCISRPGVIAIPKANSIAHVEENCGASGWHLTPQQLQALEEAFR